MLSLTFIQMYKRLGLALNTETLNTFYRNKSEAYKFYIKLAYAVING